MSHFNLKMDQETDFLPDFLTSDKPAAIEVPEMLNKRQVTQLENLLAEFKTRFANSMAEIGSCDLHE